jgi:hypothetical protein
MPSEKSRYLNQSPSAPLEWTELKTHLQGFSRERLVELLWVSAQNNNALCKALMASISMQLANGDWDKTKKAIDYALYCQNYIRYTDSSYSIILDEMLNAIKILNNQIGLEFSLRVAHYIFEHGQDMIMNFEDGWPWTLSLAELEKWITNNSSVKK